ncbi:ArfGap-domain-containing protein [Cylindrobasidium torrendii FP15055 ss-10]|uniref:ArfGap-domain-containing protein n=1 Tax=Cylindrobasidium torrendii FP15055 ss-10 TaxID=1314674 RepID=A0A0D7BHR3_9AGAR|nr:ArfGap-domain-containing protein [Cylindrobasidium torrendii FP15055 ss-10]
MANQAELKKTLQELLKREELGNKICVDCSNPNPQWASISFAIFICLQCAGHHRGYGVHISFVRSVSMDTWSEEQVKKVSLGGNRAFKEFMRNYTPADVGGYVEGASNHDIYHSWAASQYREKLEYEVAGKDWSPSLPPINAPELRKSRVSSPPLGSPGLDERYRGFGNTEPVSSSPDPAGPDVMSSLRTGWGFFSSAVAGASKAVNEKMNDPTVRAYWQDAGRKASAVGTAANAWGKERFGVDVAERVGGVMEGVSGGPERNGYGRVDQGYGLMDDPDEPEHSALYDQPAKAQQQQQQPHQKKSSWDDADWKDF